jgi:hypothetical protein
MSNGAHTSVTSILNGGLGNQMFQYATARAFAKQNAMGLALNTGAFQFDYFYKRKYALDVFNLNQIAKLVENANQANRFIRLLSLLDKRPYLKGLVNLFGCIERPFVYEPSLLMRKRRFSNVLVGYWQDERYFSQIRAELLSDFTPCNQMSIANQKIAQKISGTRNIVAIHLRCNHELATVTDEDKPLAAPKVGHAHLLSTRYYENAISKMRTSVESPQFIVFSDNPAWVKANYNIFDTDSVLENDRGSDWEDLILMSQCKHHIIANSSFSWWGAWLANSRNQVVIAPKNCPYTPTIPSRWDVME